jgi:hypothetical protein
MPLAFLGSKIRTSKGDKHTSNTLRESDGKFDLLYISESNLHISLPPTFNISMCYV